MIVTLRVQLFVAYRSTLKLFFATQVQVHQGKPTLARRFIFITQQRR